MTEPYTHGTGYGHFAVSVDDLEHAHERCSLQRLDPTPIKELNANGELAVLFFFVTDRKRSATPMVARRLMI